MSNFRFRILDFRFQFIQNQKSKIKNTSGQMLIVVFWVLGLATVGIGTLSLRAVQELRAGRLDTELLEADAAAHAAVAMAAAFVAEDDPSIDHLKEPWATGEDPKHEGLSLRDLAIGRARCSIGAQRSDDTFEAGLIDAERRLNLNTASPESLARLIDAMQRDDPGRLDGRTASEIAAAIVDWRDAEAGSWCAGGSSACHDAPFDTIGELLLVPGMAPALVAALRPHVTGDGLGTVNINTADELVVQAVGLTGSQITALLAQRQSAPLASVPNDYPPGFGVQSSCFEVPVTVTVRDSAARVRRVAVLDRSGVIHHWISVSP